MRRGVDPLAHGVEIGAREEHQFFAGRRDDDRMFHNVASLIDFAARPNSGNAYRGRIFVEQHTEIADPQSLAASPDEVGDLARARGRVALDLRHDGVRV